VKASEWDVLVDFRTPQDEDTLGRLKTECEAGEITGIVRGAIQASANSTNVNLYAGGFDPQHLWYKMPVLLEGEDVHAGAPRGIALEVSTAQELQVSVGDVVALDSTSGHHQGEVIGIFSGALPGEARLSLAFAQEVFSLEDLHTGMLLQVSEVDQVSRCLNRSSVVQQVMPLDEILDEITSLSDQITSILRIGSSVSMVVALLFVVACLGYTVLKRSPTYQLLRALGNRNWVVVATILTETWILGLCAMVLAIPIAAASAYYTAWRISQVWFRVELEMTVADFAQTFIPAFILLPLVALPMARSVLGESLDEFMRSRELG
jgi:predicted lysophospholipase L1 biosynthesis ABC-type transport system permease subunit